MKLKFLTGLCIFIPLLASATTASYFDNKEFPTTNKETLLERITGAPADTAVIPKNLISYEKDRALYSGHYVLKKDLYANEILILADGPFYATVWRGGTGIEGELKALSALLTIPSLKNNLQENDYKILRLAVYTQADKEGNTKKVYVYQNPGLRIANQDCQTVLKLVQNSGYKGEAFTCSNGTLSYIPSYSHNG